MNIWRRHTLPLTLIAKTSGGTPEHANLPETEDNKKLVYVKLIPQLNITN
jgi:hypothetical protein